MKIHQTLASEREVSKVVGTSKNQKETYLQIKTQSYKRIHLVKIHKLKIHCSRLVLGLLPLLLFSKVIDPSFTIRTNGNLSIISFLETIFSHSRRKNVPVEDLGRD